MTFLIPELNWYDFDWKTYIEKDLTQEDVKEPEKRFGLNLVQSIKIGVNRTMPDNRSVNSKFLKAKGLVLTSKISKNQIRFQILFYSTSAPLQTHCSIEQQTKTESNRI